MGFMTVDAACIPGVRLGMLDLSPACGLCCTVQESLQCSGRTPRALLGAKRCTTFCCRFLLISRTICRQHQHLYAVSIQHHPLQLYCTLLCAAVFCSICRIRINFCIVTLSSPRDDKSMSLWGNVLPVKRYPICRRLNAYSESHAILRGNTSTAAETARAGTDMRCARMPICMGGLLP